MRGKSTTGSRAGSTRVSTAAQTALATGQGMKSPQPRFPSLLPWLEPLTVAGEAGRARPCSTSASAPEAWVEPVVIAVITVFIIVAGTVVLVIGGRRRRVPVLKLDQTNPN